MNCIQRWFEAQSPLGQWAAGCAIVIAIVSLCLYGLGLTGFLLRPILVTTPPAATVVINIPTVIRQPPSSPTALPTLLLPGSTLEPTPTQAPVPTPVPTDTPTIVPLPLVTIELTATAETLSPQVTPTAGQSHTGPVPTRFSIPTPSTGISPTRL